MAIDASIYRAFAPQQRSAVQYAGEFDELQDRRTNQRDLMANNALARTFNTAKLEEFQAQRQRANALAALQQSLAGKPDDEVLAGLRGAGQFDAAGDFEKGMLERRKTRGEITKDAATAEKTFGEAQADALKRYRGALDYIGSPAGAQRWLQAQYADPLLAQHMQSLGPIEKAIGSIPQDPAGFDQWRQRAAMGMEGWLKQKLEEVKAAETGRHNVATEGLTKRGQDVSASTTRRGQDMTDARARETLTADAGGPAQVALAKQFGKPPAGYRWKADGSMEAVPGGPADIKAGEIGAKTKARQESARAQGAAVLETVREAKELTGISTAGVGGLIANVPATSARNLQAKLTTIKANLGFDRLQQMRDESPTGGALGQVAVQELIALQATVASLDQLQTPGELRKALEKIERHYSRWLETLGGASGGASGDFGAAPAPAAGGGFRYLGKE